MSNLPAQAQTEQRPAPQALKSDKPLRISKPIRQALDEMVWNGLTRTDAAKAAGIQDNSLYKALRRPDVKAAYLRELDVLRTSERARNIHALVDVRDQDENKMARVAAVKALEQISDEQQANRAANSLPGLQIVVVTGGSAQQPSIDVSPRTLTHD